MNYGQYYYHYVPSYDDVYRLLPDAPIIDDIQKAINGEYQAIVCYEQLARIAPAREERNIILEIRNDERRHLEEFSKIYAKLSGRQPTYANPKQCPDHYVTALEWAFKDEQETVDFYLDIADKAKDPFIKERFRRAAADEQNHAVWFLSFLQKIRR
ncbi:ferritin-like domain-containing protein [Bacillus niameyensis]|uniref:ferritin-like domain-containing protein n=1 Tax=Bacillus niameyensis TaxID=1522308 RepID=UPI0007847867|nr:ferritin-like domain-containing protein [Bacillus niameyensis]